jgi:hypothetical protein
MAALIFTSAVAPGNWSAKRTLFNFFTVAVANDDVPVEATSPVRFPVTFPVTSPARLPMTLPVTSPVTFPVRFPVTFPVTFPVMLPVMSPVIEPSTFRFPVTCASLLTSRLWRKASQRLGYSVKPDDTAKGSGQHPYPESGKCRSLKIKASRY